MFKTETSSENRANFPSNLSFEDIKKAYLLAILNNKKDGDEKWNDAVDELLAKYEADPDLLRDDVSRIWKENPEMIIEVVSSFIPQKVLYAEYEEEIGAIEAGIMDDIYDADESRRKTEEMNTFIEDILRGKIKGLKF